MRSCSIKQTIYQFKRDLLTSRKGYSIYKAFMNRERPIIVHSVDNFNTAVIFILD